MEQRIGWLLPRAACHRVNPSADLVPPIHRLSESTKNIPHLDKCGQTLINETSLKDRQIRLDCHRRGVVSATDSCGTLLAFHRLAGGAILLMPNQGCGYCKWQKINKSTIFMHARSRLDREVVRAAHPGDTSTPGSYRGGIAPCTQDQTRSRHHPLPSGGSIPARSSDPLGT